MLDAVKFGHENFLPVIKMIEDLAKECKKPDWVIEKKDLSEVKKKLKDYQKFVKENFKFVGDNFAYEARSVHYNKNKANKGIYGNASLKDINELKEEGIETEFVPWIEDKEN